jgi:drug/metabolite transporter (DMT)-like permease
MRARAAGAGWGQLPRLGAWWMVAAGLFFAGMGVFVKLVTKHYSGAEMVFYRSLFGAAAVFALARVRRLPAWSPHWRVHVGRSLIGLAGMLMLFHVIGVLTLSTATTLNYTSPLWLVVLTALLFKERPRASALLALALGFGGVVLLLQPTFAANQLLAGLLGLASGLCAGISFVTTRQLGRVGEPAWRVVLYFTLVCTVGAGAVAAMQGLHAITLEGLQILLGLAACATLGQLAMTRAYAEGDTLTVGSLAYSTVVFTALLSILLWHEEVPLASWLAMGLIVVSGIVAARATSQRLRVSDQPQTTVDLTRQAADNQAVRRQQTGR